MLKGYRLHGQPQKGVLLLRMRRRYELPFFLCFHRLSDSIGIRPPVLISCDFSCVHTAGSTGVLACYIY